MVDKKHHETETLNLDGKLIHLDKKILLLVGILNHMGLTTIASCQDLNSRGDAVIQFDFSVRDEQIDKIINTFKDDKLGRQITFAKWRRYRETFVTPGIYESWSLSFRTEMCEYVTDKFSTYILESGDI